MTFGSLFRGVGGFDLALTRCGFEGVYAAEIDAKCNSVCRKHWPDEMQYHDVAFVRRQHRPALLCAGWPCQGNSVAGRRAGMADARSGLWWEVVRVLGMQRPRWFLGENVPGILSVNGGRDWAACLRDLAQLGYGFAYRILDAQWFGIPQRRRRVFVVGRLGDWRSAAEILFERESLPWNSPPSREAGARIAHAVAAGAGGSKFGSGRQGQDDFVTGTLTSNGDAHSGFCDTDGIVSHTLRGEGFDASEDGTGRGTPLVSHPLLSGGNMRHDESRDTLIPILEAGKRCGTKGDARDGLGVGQPGDPMFTLQANAKHAIAYQCHGSNVGPMGTLRQGNGETTGGVPFAVAFQECQSGVAEYPEAGTLRANGPGHDPVGTRLRTSMGVRRLMPVECERLMGFPDDWTRYGAAGEEMSDSARYRMCGNSVAVPCIEWIGRRILTAQPGAPTP